MNRMLWTASLGVTIALGSCSGQDRVQTSQPPAAPVAQVPQTFPKPTVRATAPMPTIAVKGLLQPTNAQARLAQIAKTRRDPFAALLPPEIKVVTVNNPQNATPRSLPSKPVQKPLAVKTVQAPQISLTPLTPNSLPVLPPLPVNPGSTPNTSPILPPSRTSLADAIEITGVIQVGGKVTAIVQSASESTARYVQPGEYLANGSVLLKRIVMSKNGEPTIVLQQNGVEITKSIGSTRVASAL